MIKRRNRRGVPTNSTISSHPSESESPMKRMLQGSISKKKDFA